MTNKIINPHPYPTPSVSLLLVSLAMEILFFIIKLIFLGITESEAIMKASVKYNIPVETVKDIWKNHK